MYTYCIAERGSSLQRSIQEIISGRPYHLISAGSASAPEECLSLYEKARPDLFFVDAGSCGPEGLSFIAQAQEMRLGSRTLFILLCEHFEYRQMQQAIRLKIFDLLRNPVSIHELQEAADRAVQELRETADRAVQIPACSETGIGAQDKACVPSPDPSRASILAGHPPDWTGRTRPDSALAYTMTGQYNDRTGRNGPNPDPSRACARIEQICAYIQERYPEDLSIKKIADAFFLSESHVSHMFRRIMGISIQKYLENVRLLKARQLLCDTQLPVTEIALRVGYRDGNYFAKCFRRRFGGAPSSCRKNAGKYP